MSDSYIDNDPEFSQEIPLPEVQQSIKLNNSKEGQEYRKQAEGKSRKERTMDWRSSHKDEYNSYMKKYMSDRRAKKESK